MNTIATPPALPKAARLIGKILVAIAYVLGLWCLIQTEYAHLHATGWWVLGFLVISHIGELFYYRAFLQHAQATAFDYAQTFAFGIFHSAGLRSDTC